MSVQVNTAFVQTFSNSLIHLAQQKGSRLLQTVKVESVNGKYHHFDRLGATTAQKQVSRHEDTPLIDTPHSRRRVTMDTYRWADLIDNPDKVRMLIDPTSDYARAGAWALGRSMDDVILSAAIGNATSIASDDTSSSVAFDTGMIVDEDFNTADSNLIVEKVIEASRLLSKKEVDMDEQKYLIVNSSAVHHLIQEVEVASSDYNALKPLMSGRIAQWFGFDIIPTERISGTADGTDTDPVICLAYLKSAIGFAMGDSINVRISERSDKNYSTQVFAEATFGATRIEEEKIVQIQCVQAA